MNKSFLIVICVGAMSVNHAAEQLSVDENHLGWVFDSEQAGFCSGYYVEPLLDFKSANLAAQGDTRITAGPVSFLASGRSKLSGGVVVDQSDKQLRAETAYIYRSTQLDKIELVDNVAYREQGSLLLGESGYYFPAERKGGIYNTQYRRAFSAPEFSGQGIAKYYGLNARGRADYIELHSSGDYEMHNATFTACPPANNDWHISAKNIYVDHEKGRAYAQDAVVKIKDVPVFYLPYFSYPIDDRRQTGFLAPSFGYNSKSGAEITIPFYWNIAPQIDATLHPRIMAKRGVLWQAQLRYLTRANRGEFNGSFIYNDRYYAKFKRENPQIKQGKNHRRSALQFRHETDFGSGWRARMLYNQVSDDYFLQDFNATVGEITQNQLLRQIDVSYTSEHWYFLTRLENYQTLHPINQVAVHDQYSRLPQLKLLADFPDRFAPFAVQVNTQFDNFVWTKSNVAEQAIIQGQRSFVNPVVSLPLRREFGFIVPSVQLHATQYDLYGRFDVDKNRYLSKNVSRVVPIFSIDNGLFFDRDIRFGENNYIQTIEPRLFYLYVPYKEQRNIKVFDSAYHRFDFDQLFRVNRFAGIDRIGDANQLALALTTRLRDAQTGIEKLRASIGQIFYFKTRRVQLCNNSTLHPDCKDNTEQRKNAVHDTAKASRIPAQIVYSLTPGLSISSNIIWNPYNKKTDYDINLSYQSPTTEYLTANLSYSVLVDGDSYEQRVKTSNKFTTQKRDLKQLNVSATLPLSTNWRALGTARYNVSASNFSSAYLGLEYESCCWAVRLVGGSRFTRFNSDRQREYSRAVFLQVLFKGFGTVANTEASSIVRDNFSGYKDIFN